MVIRQGTENDIPSIIELLKVSLGESFIPKSEKLWKWKHEANPFGKSPVLLAEENGVLVGLRAFLRWEYLEKGNTIKACRAVDTATHPDHQGKGIFNKLTLNLTEEIQKEGCALIFNTPNTKSTPGYLKMGWEKWGKLPLKLNFHLGNPGNQKQEDQDWNLVSELVEKIESSAQLGAGIETKIVRGYIHWRYRDNPLFPYHFLSNGESYMLIYRIKEGKMGREFRICDLFTIQELSKTSRKELQNSLNQQIKASGTRFSSFSGLKYSNQNDMDMGLLPIMKIGPLVTLRNVADGSRAMDQAWNWSLGDLEVF